jgi:hypothetical protein
MHTLRWVPTLRCTFWGQYQRRKRTFPYKCTYWYECITAYVWCVLQTVRSRSVRLKPSSFLWRTPLVILTSFATCQILINDMFFSVSQDQRVYSHRLFSDAHHRPSCQLLPRVTSLYCRVLFQFHKICACTAIVFSLMHTTGHLVNFYHVSTQPSHHLKVRILS